MSQKIIYQLSNDLEHGEVLRSTYQELMSTIERLRWAGGRLVEECARNAQAQTMLGRVNSSRALSALMIE